MSDWYVASPPKDIAVSACVAGLDIVVASVVLGPAVAKLDRGEAAGITSVAALSEISILEVALEVAISETATCYRPPSV